MARINVEGASIQEIMEWPESYFDDLVLIDKPIVVNIGTAEVLGQFAIKEKRLIIELAQIDGGGEGVLPAISKLSNHIAKLKNLSSIECIVHAINCVKPNLKLRAHLEKTGFEIKLVEGKGEAYFKRLEIT